MNIISSFERPLMDGRGLRVAIVTDAAPADGLADAFEAAACAIVVA